jgi:hypothetical protein
MAVRKNAPPALNAKESGIGGMAFISYSSANNVAAIALSGWLSEQGLNDVSLDARGGADPLIGPGQSPALKYRVGPDGFSDRRSRPFRINVVITLAVRERTYATSSSHRQSAVAPTRPIPGMLLSRLLASSERC